MLSTVHQTPPKMRATTATTCTNCTAVALTERSAAFLSFQRQIPGFPPTQNVNSAPHSLIPAVQFSGSIAQIAENAVTTASFVTF